MPFPGIHAMALCRAAEAAALSGDVTGGVAGELVRVVRDLGGVRWVARALMLAALALEARGRPADAAAAFASAERLGEATATTPALAGLQASCRSRVADALGTARHAEIEAATAFRSPDQALLHALSALDACGIPGLAARRRQD
jgi:hypothetical protein